MALMGNYSDASLYWCKQASLMWIRVFKLQASSDTSLRARFPRWGICVDKQQHIANWCLPITTSPGQGPGASRLSTRDCLLSPIVREAR